jgi:hypothetical protein
MSETVQPISIAYPGEGGSTPRLKLTLAPIRLRISAADQEEWLTGSFTDPTGQMPLNVQTDGNNLRLTSSRNVTKFRSFKAPELQLTISTRRPFSLSMDLGASDQTQVDLGGLPITDAEIKLGAGQAKFDVSQPNPQALGTFGLRGGAVELSLSGLGNLNARKVEIDGGAASVTIDFGGPLQRDLDAAIRTGMASTEIVVPKTTSARIRAKTTLSGVNVGDGFTVKDGAFSTLAFLGGQQPTLTIDLQAALGSVALKIDDSIALPG